MTEEHVQPAVGTIVGGRYELIEVAGRGGMATVWRAHVLGDLGFSRTVAVKQMHPHLADQAVYVEMFVEEARVGADLESPNIAHAYDFIAEHGNFYLVMEWIEGIDLGSYIHYFSDRGVRTRWELVVAIGIGVLRGLSSAHERKGADGAPAPVVHRDVSPHNVLLTTNGMVKLIDFGLALAEDRGRELTEPGVVKGKMSYLSPEIVAGRRPSPLSDQFSCGSLMWEALVGRKLFDGATDYDTYAKLRDALIQPLKPFRSDVPSRLVTLINRALSARDDKRFPSAREMARQLSTVLKKTKARKDLHALLATSVIEARQGMGLGRRTGEPTTETPIADLEIPDTIPAPEAKGLRHRIPFFGRKR